MVVLAATVVVVAPCVVLVVAGTVVSTAGAGGVDDAFVVVEADGLPPADGVGASGCGLDGVGAAPRDTANVVVTLPDVGTMA